MSLWSRLAIAAAFAAAPVAPTWATQVVGGPILGPAQGYLLLATPEAPGYGGPDPALFVALNPQPLPPRVSPHTLLSLADAANPVYDQPAVGRNFATIFGVRNGICKAAYGAPNETGPGSFEFFPNNPCLQLDLTVTVSPFSSVADDFNPQPDPPGDAFSVAVLAFNTNVAADPMMTFGLSFTPPGGSPIPFRFSPIPEPGAMTVLIAGLLGLGGVRRRG